MSTKECRIPTFSVVIPAYNRPERLMTALRNLALIEYPYSHWDVIIVDDGSIEPLEPLMRDIMLPVPIRFLRQSNTGPGGARNLAAKASRMDYLAFTADDCAPDPNWLRTLADAFTIDGNAHALIGGIIRHAIPDNPCATASHLLVEYITITFNAKAPSFFTPNNLAVHRKCFLDAGGFNDAIGATGEDREFCARWISRGNKVCLEPRSVVSHAHPLTLREFIRQQYSYGVGSSRFRRIHASQGQAKPALEPIRFYFQLIIYPFRTQYPRKAVHALLLIVSQAANAFGVINETIRPRMASR